ncbi:hypothetical protein J4413_01340 [Candidatus Woesearchaeota archaeon]|nr:hypothetical protein [Candidatus Woesearchaeota archaeon]
MIIKDSMVLIHLAKLSILEKSCVYFKEAAIPELVYEEIIKGKERKFPEVPIIINLIKEKKISVRKIKNKGLIKKANQFNIQGGEAEAIALYWQEKAEVIATDDDNVRKKKLLLEINIIGTPAIIIKLYKKKLIDKKKVEECISGLRKIGWFSNVVLDQINLEVEK